MHEMNGHAYLATCVTIQPGTADPLAFLHSVNASLRNFILRP
jgi:hypothetical protein